jgi:hypothetical protein
VGADSDSNKLKEFLHAKIEKRKKQIHPAHNPRFNHDLQLEIDCIEWALKKIELNKIPNDRLEWSYSNRRHRMTTYLIVSDYQ